MRVDRIADMLGVGPGSGAKGATLEQLRARLRAGLPYRAVEAVASQLAISPESLGALLRVPPRTLARRKKEKRLHADESDRLFRLGRLAALAEEILGSREQATRWLHAPNRALARQSPLERLDSDLGAREVEDLLLRIAHGVYS